MIPYGRQDIRDEDIQAVVAALLSNNLTQGPTIDRFEDFVKQNCGAKYAVAVNSATSALHIACMALGLGPGDTLWTTPNTFVASANCALYCGAKVDFVDIDSKTYNISINELEKKLLKAEAAGCLPKIVVPVHFAGQSCDMPAIHGLAKRFGFKIIEDASHAIGGKYCNEPIGSCRWSDITIFSFHPVKIITTAEGGMALTNDKELATRLGLLRSHGITRDPELMTGEMEGPWYYQQVYLGFNYRMTDLQASLGCTQIQRLHEYVDRRQELAGRYNQLLCDFPVILPEQDVDSYSAFHLYVIQLRLNEINKTHKEVFEYFRAKDVLVNLHYIPIHLQPFYQKMGFKSGDFPCAEAYYKQAISIPLYPNLTEAQQDEVVSVLKEALQ